MEALELAPMKKDKESDYFAMGFRLYDPEIGRFLAIDPLLDMQPSQTPYHYCFNNPTSFTDPTGLYPEKEKGDKVLEVVPARFRREYSESLLEQQLAMPRTATPYEETKSFMRDKWDAESWALNSEQNYYFLFKNGISWLIWNGQPVSSSGRTGTQVGSMSYSINGVEGEIIYRYNDNQDKEQVEKKIRESLDYQCKDFTTQIQLQLYFLECNTICVDVTMIGRDLADAYNEDWKYLDGSSSNEWKYPDLAFLGSDKEKGYSTEGLEDGWIYIASEFLENKTNRNAHEYWTYGNSWLSVKNTGYYDFNMTFGHEVGHNLDAYFINEPIYRELNVRMRTQRQFRENNRGRYYHDEYLP